MTNNKTWIIVGIIIVIIIFIIYSQQLTNEFKKMADTCTDTFQNQDETDVDCGGTICSPCDLGQSCSINNDCVSNNCDAGTCAIIPSCDVTFSETINYLNKWVGCGVDPCT